MGRRNLVQLSRTRRTALGRKTGPGEDDTDSPARLRASAAELRARAEVFQARADALLAEAEVREKAANEIEAARKKGRQVSGQTAQSDLQSSEAGYAGLPERPRSPIVDTRMLAAEHILAISKGKTRREGQTDDLVGAAHKKGLSLRGVARAVTKRLRRKVTVQRISMARKGHRPIDKDIADAVAEVTGFAATPRNWPGGIADAD